MFGKSGTGTRNDPKAEICDPGSRDFQMPNREIWGEISCAFRNVAKIAILLSFHKERFQISKLKKLKVVILGDKIFQSIKKFSC